MSCTDERAGATDGSVIVAVLMDAVTPSRQARALAGALRLGWRPIVDRVDGRFLALNVLRTALDTGTTLLRPVPRVRVEQLRAQHADPFDTGRPISGEWIRPADPEPGAILYLHGGAYAFCSPRTHRTITSRLADDTGLPVLALRYRLAPEHPFPAAFQDALSAYQWLLDEEGVPASRIVVAGDSSGGHLAATTVAEICRSGLPCPAGMVLFSPWVDLTCESSALGDRELRDPFISPGMGRHFGRLYVGGHDWSDPRLSLLDCVDVELPPMLVQVGGIEVLRAEAERLVETLTGAGNACELQIWPEQMHVFQIFNRLFPEARAAMREAAAFIRARLE